MCHKCLKEVAPDRGTSTMNGGSYFLNFKGCGACDTMSLLKIIEKKKEESELNETISFTHICPSCNHEIAKHLYQFKLKGKFQKYRMECDLCGIGKATCSIEPEDPRIMQKYLNH